MPQESWAGGLYQSRVPRAVDRAEAPAAPVPFWGAVSRGWRDQVENNNTDARAAMWRADLRARHAEIERLTGAPLAWMQGMEGSVEFGQDMATDSDPYGADAAIRRRASAAALSEAEYERRLAVLKATDPRLAGIPDMAALRRRFDERQRAVRAAADEAGGSGWQGAVGTFVGGTAGSLVDPVNVTTGLVTGGAGAGRGLVMRMTQQAAAGATAEALMVPGRAMEAQRYGGPEYGGDEAGRDILAAGLFGAAFEPVGDAVSASLRMASRRFGGSTEPEERGLSAAIDQLLDDEATLGDVADFDGARAALARGEPRPAVEPEQDLDALFSSASEGGVSGRVRGLQPESAGTAEEVLYHGRRISMGRFDPLALEVDPVRFQYKADGDGEGVTARLRGVERWDALASGKVMVFEDLDGRRIVADGHQRRGLARRLALDGWEDAALDGYLFRAADGWSPREVRVLAALKNIREGSGSILDAAKLFREAPGALRDRSLPVTGDFIHQARALARLDDEAFRAIVNGVIPERLGAVLGEMAGDRPDLHGDLIALLKRSEIQTAEGARALVQEAMLDDFIATDGVQMDLFGGLPREATVIQRAQIREAVMRGLRRDERLFASLVRNADAIETGGNVLARNANEKALAIDRAAGELVSRLSLRAGAMGEAFQEAARSVTLKQTTPAQAARGLITRIRRAVRDGEALDMDRAALLTPEPPGPSARAAAAAFDNPAGAGQRAQIAAKPEDVEIEAEAVNAGLFDDLPDEEAGFDRAIRHLTACAPGKGG